MIVLNSIAQRKILDLLNTLSGKGDNPISIEKDMLLSVMDAITDIVQTSGLPTIKTLPIVNPNETEITSEYMNDFQKEVYDAFTYYSDILTQVGTDLNAVITIMSDYLESVQKVVDTQGQSIENLRHLILMNLNNNAVLDEINVKFETLKGDNLTTANVLVTGGGNILLPTSVNQIANTYVKSASFEILSPIQAQNVISFNSNVSGLSNDKIIIPGYFEGKLFGLASDPNDVRLSSYINYIIDGRDDTKWECEFVTDTIISSSFQALVKVTFQNNQILNQISIDTSADARAFYYDTSGNKIYLSGSGAEYFTEFNGTELYLELTQNVYKQTSYTLDTVTKNGFITHTYNTLETLNHYNPSDVAIQFPEVKIVPVRVVEEQTRPEDVVPAVFADKYRYAITVNNLNVQRNTYQSTGLLETQDIAVPNEIYGVEIEASSYIPSFVIEWIKYSLSFDGGKTWNRIRPTNESASLYNALLPDRIQLQDTTPDTDVLVLPSRANKVRLRIELTSNDTAVSPVVYGFNMRIKER